MIFPKVPNTLVPASAAGDCYLFVLDPVYRNAVNRVPYPLPGFACWCCCVVYPSEDATLGLPRGRDPTEVTGHEPSVSQYVFLDFVLSSVPILTFALVEPAEFVVSWRPPQSLMHPVALLSLISFLGWQALAYIAAWKYCIKQPWFIPYVGAPFSQKPSAESTTIFYTASWSCIAAAVTFSHGIPFRKTVLSNKYFSLWVVGNILLTAWFTVLPPNLVGDWLHLIQSPHVEFNIVLLLMGTINICVSFLCEVVVVQKLFGRFLWPKLRRRFKFKQCEKIEAELRAKPNWPPVGVVSTEDVKNTYSRQSSSYSRQSFLRASTKQRQFLPPDDMRILPGVTHHNNRRGPRENAEAMKDGGGSRYPAASVDQPDYQQEPPRDDPNYAWSPELDPNPDGDKSGPGNGVFQWFRGAQRSFKTFTSGRRGEYKVAEARESFRLRDAVNGTEIQPLKSAEDTDWLPLPPTPIAITDGSQPKMFPIDIDDDDEEPPPPPPPAPTAADAIEEGDDEESRRGRPVKKQRSFIFTHDDINETLPLSNSAKSSATTRENILQSPSATKSGPSEENNSVIPIDDHNNKSVPHKPERRGIISGSMKNRAFDETGASSSDGKNQSSGNSKSEDHDDYYEDVGNCSGLEYFSPSRTSTSSFRRPTSLLKSDEYYS
ncbi:unnamed protein product [Notodromas monacha]|uniref:Uncharacterized protein n=1 Tax=Notodromas monacha TaxID=399045 RepID=A0A7R9BM93_9CRUS|nr:unnamed protein product [Notodromas monacha]CAG0916992.1 unnamed protein product [Notodromas monacha]